LTGQEVAFLLLGVLIGSGVGAAIGLAAAVAMMRLMS